MPFAATAFLNRFLFDAYLAVNDLPLCRDGTHLMLQDWRLLAGLARSGLFLSDLVGALRTVDVDIKFCLLHHGS